MGDDVKYVLKLVFGPWEKSFKCFGHEKIMGACGFKTEKEAIAFGKWIIDNAEELKGNMREDAQVEKAQKRPPRS